jgi:hypothetical protein
MIEQMFYQKSAQHRARVRRLRRVDSDLHDLVADTTRTVAMLVIAILLILVLLPAAVAANGT